MAATVLEAEARVNEVHIEGLALLKIVKHCHDSLPQMVTGSLLGLTESSSGVLEITHAFPFPDSKLSNNNVTSNQNDRNKTTADALKASAIAGANAASGAGGGDGDNDDGGMAGHDFQLEMMRMLREVNVDNNCVGWYQSMYLGIYSTSALLESQWSYQTDLSPNAVVLLYDPMQTANGNLALHCYRLTEKCLQLKTSGKNQYIHPDDIFEQVPVKLVNPGLVKALLSDIEIGTTNAIISNKDKGHYGAKVGTVNAVDAAANSHPLSLSNTDTSFDRLDLSTNPYLEKHLEFLCSWVDDLSSEQHKFQYYTRHLSQQNKNKNKQDKNNDNKDSTEQTKDWTSDDAPRRIESLLITNQIRSYCNQVDRFAGGGLGKLFLAGGLHKEEEKKSAA